MSKFDKYMAIPFKDKGRSFDGADCFGLCALVSLHEAHIAIADPGVSLQTGKRATIEVFAAELAIGHWFKIEMPQTFDWVVMTGFTIDGGKAVRHAELHCGIMIDEKMMLHTEAHCGPRIVAIDDSEITHRIRYFCRPAALMDSAAA